MRAWIALWIAGLRKDEGQTVVEYGVLLLLILSVSVLVITALGVDVKSAYNAVEDQIGGGSQAS